MAAYQRLAHATIDEILAEGSMPIVVGGTGLYLRAALAELDLPPPPAPGERERAERLYERLGAEGAHALLAERDPEAAASSIRTTGGASSARSSSRRPARACVRVKIASGASTRGIRR